ncbi:immunoglobulin-like and fibronectin type III domain-containing protein 1 isoform X3 [Osmerus eperlanus]|uniref:immunoglobulin-like and fibronectin type III domain-containing protein 1 isoform X3 n=1 Tax=Osmerus eperlanus TaxID=29151 RepID=UPI002E0D5D6B
MWKKSKITDQTANGQGPEQDMTHKKRAGIKRKSKVPGVMITQYVEELPEGKSTPDFLRKPIALTIQEGKLAVFKARVSGDPKPEVTWRRAQGDMSNMEKFQNKFDEATGEYHLEMPKVTSEEADTYKCYASNEYGKAVCTVILNVIEVGFKKKKAMEEMDASSTNPTEFRKLLRKRAKGEKKEEKHDGEIDERFWEVIMSADRKDYERICAEYGVKDFRVMLKKLNEKKEEREVEQAKYVEYLSNLKHIDLKGDGSASFEFEMELKDPTSRVFLYKDGVMLPFSDEMAMKHNLKTVGKKLIFTVKDLLPEDAGLYQVDVEEVNVFSTDFKIPCVDFIVKIQEVKAKEREDALFECVLSHPIARIKWTGKNSPLEHGDKYSISASEDKLIHRLLIKDCMQLDKGIYSASAGIKSCSAWLMVEADTEPAPTGKKKARKTTQAGGAGVDLEKLAEEQQGKLQKEKEERIEAIIKAKEEQQATIAENVVEEKAADDSALVEDPPVGRDTSKDKQTEIPPKKQEPPVVKSSISDGGQLKPVKEEPKVDASPKPVKTSPVVPNKVIAPPKSDVPEPDTQASEGDNSGRKRNTGPPVSDKVIDPKEGQSGPEEPEESPESNKSSGRTRQGPLLKDTVIGQITDPKEGQSGPEEPEESPESNKSSGRTRQGPLLKDKVIDPKEGQSGPEEPEESPESNKRSGRTRQGPLLKDTVIDPGVQFVSGLSDVTALMGQPAELLCKVNSEQCEGAWFRDGKKISTEDGLTISKDGSTHKLLINSCQEEHSGKYRFEADGRKTEAMLNVKDPPRFDQNDLDAFSKPVTVKVGQNAIFKLPFVGCEPMKIQWYRDGEELLDESNVKIEKSTSHSRLLLSKCQRKETGEIKIRLKNEHGILEAVSKLIVLDKPTPPQGPVEVLESSAVCIDIKWRSPKDNGGRPVKNYLLERQQVGRNTWKKIGEIPGVPTYKDTDVDHGRKYCYRIRAVTEEGISEMIETDDIQAGTLAFPGVPAPPKVVSASNTCINLTWTAPSNTGGSRIVGYTLEKRKKGSNLWSYVNPTEEPIQEKKYVVKDIAVGMEYEFRVTAINVSGPGEPSNPSEFVFARDPKKPPGKVEDLKVTDTSYTTLSLSWTKPREEKGVQDDPKGYYVEVRQAESLEWARCNVTPILLTSFTVKGLKALSMYWVRVIATNEGGDGVPQDMDNYILAMPPPVRPRFTNNKVKSFMVVRAGNTVRITINFEASPWPEVDWLKDNVPVTKRVTISNSDGSSQMLIPSSERSDSGVYTIMVKNLVGQETFSVEVRVTDDPKPPGPVELEENVPGTVTVIWESSPDEKRDDHLHYTVSKLESTKNTWSSVADRVFNNKYTVCNIMPGREYHFRVYAKNDMGMSAPSESPTWGIERRKEKFVVNMPIYKTCDLRSPPAFLVPLKQHNAPKGYECYISCAVKGDPKPRITWYRNNVSLNTNTNYYISNICGVCSLLILHVGPKDVGEYTIIAENAMGRAECSTKFSVRE